MTSVAPTRSQLDVRALWSLPTLYHPVLSHRRDKVAFYWDKSGRIELYIVDIATREVRQLSHGEPPRALRSFYVWTPDDRALVFARDEKGDENHDLYRIDAASGAVTRLTRDPRSEKHAIAGFADHAVSDPVLCPVSNIRASQSLAWPFPPQSFLGPFLCRALVGIFAPFQQMVIDVRGQFGSEIESTDGPATRSYV